MLPSLRATSGDSGVRYVWGHLGPTIVSCFWRPDGSIFDPSVCVFEPDNPTKILALLPIGAAA